MDTSYPKLFRHELIREAVLVDLLPGERAQAHRRFAEALQGADAARWAGEPERGLALVEALLAAAMRACADAATVSFT